ncbi:MAG: hypothetical protein EZS28_021834 [Streblomastix strix]|uniref:Uncharacterized protein n=1 Tax=Streblomastix strix TaxID=222440 RepID=A0A5J4VJG5_9EUKA|nr:MAG: hypothetical protein EZS28_021834 [Streblomastix strix]
MLSAGIENCAMYIKKKQAVQPILQLIGNVLQFDSQLKYQTDIRLSSLKLIQELLEVIEEQGSKQYLNELGSLLLECVKRGKKEDSETMKQFQSGCINTLIGLLNSCGARLSQPFLIPLVNELHRIYKENEETEIELQNEKDRNINKQRSNEQNMFLQSDLKIGNYYKRDEDDDEDQSNNISQNRSKNSQSKSNSLIDKDEEDEDDDSDDEVDKEFNQIRKHHQSFDARQDAAKTGWYRIASLLQNKFQPMLQVVIPPLIKQSQKEIKIKYARSETADVELKGMQKQEIGDNLVVGVQQNALNDREISLALLGMYVEEMGPLMEEYSDSIVETAVKCLKEDDVLSPTKIAADLISTVIQSLTPPERYNMEEYELQQWRREARKTDKYEMSTFGINAEQTQNGEQIAQQMQLDEDLKKEIEPPPPNWEQQIHAFRILQQSIQGLMRAGKDQDNSFQERQSVIESISQDVVYLRYVLNPSVSLQEEIIHRQQVIERENRVVEQRMNAFREGIRMGNVVEQIVIKAYKKKQEIDQQIQSSSSSSQQQQQQEPIISTFTHLPLIPNEALSVSHIEIINQNEFAEWIKDGIIQCRNERNKIIYRRSGEDKDVKGGTDEKEDDNEIEDGDKTMTSFIELIEALLTVYKEKWKNGYMIISPVIADMLSDVNEEIIRQQKLNYEQILAKQQQQKEQLEQNGSNQQTNNENIIIPIQFITFGDRINGIYALNDYIIHIGEIGLQEIRNFIPIFIKFAQYGVDGEMKHGNGECIRSDKSKTEIALIRQNACYGIANSAQIVWNHFERISKEGQTADYTQSPFYEFGAQIIEVLFKDINVKTNKESGDEKRKLKQLALASAQQNGIVDTNNNNDDDDDEDDEEDEFGENIEDIDSGILMARDNAISALMRIVVCQPFAIPGGDDGIVHTKFTIFENLPISIDEQEGYFVNDRLWDMIEKQDAAILGSGDNSVAEQVTKLLAGDEEGIRNLAAQFTAEDKLIDVAQRSPVIHVLGQLCKIVLSTVDTGLAMRETDAKFLRLLFTLKKCVPQQFLAQLWGSLSEEKRKDLQKYFT